MSASAVGSPVPAGARRAGLLRRCAALAYEALLLAALLLIAGFALIPFVSPGASSSTGPVVPSGVGRAVSLLALFVLGGWFFAWCWSRGRRTLPMKTWHLAAVDGNGRALTPRRALARYLAVWIGPIVALAVYAALGPRHLGVLALPVLALNWWWALVDPDRQFLHDRLAGTRLVMSSAEAAAPGATALPRPQ